MADTEQKDTKPENDKLEKAPPAPKKPALSPQTLAEMKAGKEALKARNGGVE
ncbi:MAG TPA: hypothetical protein VKT73_15100 [Xanthobacteraceae bacterium]|nr:hypothetical protein [Xanthobacteraceae bacterium]